MNASNSSKHTCTGSKRGSDGVRGALLRLSTSARGHLTFASCLLVLFATAPASGQPAPREPVKNIVLVHGAWADGSSWSGVIQRLQKAGYFVTAVQIPNNSLDEDVTRVRGVLANKKVRLSSSAIHSVVRSLPNSAMMPLTLWLSSTSRPLGRTRARP